MKATNLWMLNKPNKLNREWREEFVKRSDVPKELRYNVKDKTSMESFLDRFFDRQPVRRVKLNWQYSDTKSLCDVFERDLPDLEYLTLLASCCPSESAGLPPPLKIKNAPRLRTLIVENILIPWEPRFFANLTTLKIHMEVNDRSLVEPLLPSTEVLHSVLSSMKQLASLSLHSIFPKHDPLHKPSSLTLPDTCRDVEFQNFEDTPDMIAFFLTLNISPKARVSITIGEESDTDTRWLPSFLELISSRAGEGHAPQAAQVTFRGTEPDMSARVFHGDPSLFIENPEIIKPYNSHCLPSTLFSLGWDWMNWRLIFPFSSAFDTSELVSLYIETDFWDEDEIFGDYYPDLPLQHRAKKVRVLAVEHRPALDWLLKTLTKSFIDTRSGEMTMCFPELDTFIIDYDKAVKQFSVETKECLKVRKDKGYPIRVLRIPCPLRGSKIASSFMEYTSVEFMPTVANRKREHEDSCCH